MHRSALRPAIAVALATATVGLFLHGCQDTPEVTEPELATAVTKALTVKGAGTGSGVVTSSPAGINCTITAGVAAASGCVARFPQGTVVTLTATPRSGHAFKAWSGACTGSTCRLTMSVGRTATARFVKGPFTVKVSGGTAAGSGTVASQPGLTPAIACTITNGTPAATGCQAKYPAYTEVVLTATPAAGSTFSGWGAPCSGTGSCRYVAVQNVTIPARFGATGSPPSAAQGRWEAPFSTPVVAIHLHVLPTGKVLVWGHTGDAYVWDPANPGIGFKPVGAPYEVFCSGHALMPDGRLFVAGGHIANNYGLPAATIFDPATETWSLTPPMQRGRWYPTVTALPNGEMLVLAGSDENAVDVTVGEVWTGSAWRRLTTASLALPYYPSMFVAPNGKLFYAGYGTTTRYLDVSGTGQWTTVAERPGGERPTGSAVMYAPGKILSAGGGKTTTATAEVIDLNQPSPGWRSIAPMAFPRRHMMATLLADGTVLVTHGTSGLANDQAAAVHSAERWNPATESWTTMAREAAGRVYHSAAVLLPDGRVLSSGSGEGAGVTYANSQFTAEIFTPPYLFNPDGSLAARPTITAAPSVLTYGATFSVESPDAASVTRGTLVRLGSSTHSFNQGQHIYPLTFSADGSTLTAAGPGNPNLAPPGYYMLFLVNSAGVPSVSRMVRVGS
jgi:hypothetical protein